MTMAYVGHARESALALARQRGYQGHELNEAVESGALTDAEWCECLDKARELYDVGGTRAWAERLDRVAQAVEQQPGCTLVRLSKALNYSHEWTRALLRDLIARDRVMAQGLRHLKYFPKER